MKQLGWTINFANLTQYYLY
nr:hypothetical protein [Flavobacterium circumlabens]